MVTFSVDFVSVCVSFVTFSVDFVSVCVSLVTFSIDFVPVCVSFEPSVVSLSVSFSIANAIKWNCPLILENLFATTLPLEVLYKETSAFGATIIPLVIPISTSPSNSPKFHITVSATSRSSVDDDILFPLSFT